MARFSYDCPLICPIIYYQENRGDREMDVRERVEQCIENISFSARELRRAAQETENTQAQNAFVESAQKIEDCLQQCRIALNQFK